MWTQRSVCERREWIAGEGSTSPTPLSCAFLIRVILSCTFCLFACKTKSRSWLKRRGRKCVGGGQSGEGGILTAMAKSWACAISASCMEVQSPPIENVQESTAASEKNSGFQWCCLAPRFPLPFDAPRRHFSRHLSPFSPSLQTFSRCSDLTVFTEPPNLLVAGCLPFRVEGAKSPLQIQKDLKLRIVGLKTRSARGRIAKKWSRSEAFRIDGPIQITATQCGPGPGTRCAAALTSKGETSRPSECSHTSGVCGICSLWILQQCHCTVSPLEETAAAH